MKHDEQWGWKMAWSGVGLIAAGCLLGYLLRSPGVFGLDGIFYYVVAAVLCLIYVAAIYIVIRKFFGKKGDK